ncbi:MAG: phosphatase PAP2 family protein [Paucibacter sp.]|nr:phosphatase PAP2 family protein [Roseateles sp.]
MDANKIVPALCAFQPGDWMPQYQGRSKPLHRLMPSTWRNGLTLPDIPVGDKAIAECAELLKKKNDEREARKGEIKAQAPTPNDSVELVQRLLGNPMAPYKPASVELRALVLASLEAPIFALKEDVNRGRPGRCCPAGLDPMFPSGPLHPGHPSYPSGHATQAHAMAIVLGFVKPSLAGDFVKAAQRVAENREIAGLHYASDSAAGWALAKHLVGLLMLNQEFSDLVKEAYDEWNPPRP